MSVFLLLASLPALYWPQGLEFYADLPPGKAALAAAEAFVFGAPS